MIYIYTDHFQQEINDATAKIEGLSSALSVKPLIEIDPRNNHVIIVDTKLQVPISWDNTEPPILFEPVQFSTNDLIAILLCKLGYEKEAKDFTDNISLKESIRCFQQLRDLDQSIGTLSPGDRHHSVHNQAVLTHYAGHFHNGVSIEKLYEKAVSLAPTEEHSAFAARHLGVFLMDQGDDTAAEKLLRNHAGSTLSKVAGFHLKLDLINVLMASHKLPYDQERIKELKELIWQCLQYFEQQEIYWAIASLYTSASEIAKFENSYSESLGYISKAITIYEEQEFPEFLAYSYIRKATLLYTWAQDENPQFYQSAIDTYQKALETFSREHFPDIYAEIHHNLAVIYAEMPVDEKKKGMWSAFSATSFKECLDFYQKEQYPFEYAMVANNYANALLKYPPARTGDNAEKAIYYYMEALEIRNADQFPLERAHTILNYLEACWRVHNINKTMEHARFKDMLAKAKEVKRLTDNYHLISQAQSHLDQISALGLAIMKE